jgi:hypothetical protein
MDHYSVQIELVGSKQILRSLQAIKGAKEGTESSMVRFEIDYGAAGRTGNLRILLKPTERLAELVAASGLRAD